MSLTDIYEMLDSIPEFKDKVAYHHFPVGAAPELPYIVYLTRGTDNFSADNKVYAEIEDIDIGTSFELSIAENVCIVGNENEIRRCISLLLDNAFRYVNKSGFVSIKLQNLVSGAEIKISNSTDGVEKGSLDNWFDRFYRRDLSRNSDTGGSGIGLSVVKAIVLAHGGSVKAHSHDGETVEFVINI